jgi:hypothetical protein
MVDLFCILFILSVFGFILGLINPKIVIRWGTIKTRARVTLVYGSAIIIFFILTGITGSQKRKLLKDATIPKEVTNVTEELTKKNDKHTAQDTTKKQIEKASEPVISTSHQDRIAIITDQSGEIFKVKSLYYYEPFSIIYRLYEDAMPESFDKHLIVHTKTFKIAIPFSLLISVDTKGEKREVIYKYNGTEIKLSGTLASGTFNGKTEFGNLKLESEKLNRISYKAPPGPTLKRKKQSRSYDATFTLSDGTTVPVFDIRRHDNYYSTEGYAIGGTRRFKYFMDLRFLKGVSLMTYNNAQKRKYYKW